MGAVQREHNLNNNVDGNGTTRYDLADSGYQYEMYLDRPEYARGNTFPILATLTALIGVTGQQVHTPSLSAWGKHDREVRENLEVKIRAWLADNSP